MHLLDGYKVQEKVMPFKYVFNIGNSDYLRIAV